MFGEHRDYEAEDAYHRQQDEIRRGRVCHDTNQPPDMGVLPEVKVMAKDPNYQIPVPDYCATSSAPPVPPIPPAVGYIYTFVSKSGAVINGKLTASGLKNYLVINLVTGAEIMLDKHGIVDVSPTVKHEAVTAAALTNAIDSFREYQEEDGGISVGEYLLGVIRDGNIHLVFWEPKP